VAPEFLSPGVFIQEVQGKNGQIPIASTSTFAMAGYSPRGPEGRAYSHGSLKEFFDRFGGFSAKSFNAYAAAAFFANGGSQLVFVRQLHSDATSATATFPGSWTVHASGRGTWANQAVMTLTGNPNFYQRSTATYSRFDVMIELVDSSTGLLALSESYEALVLDDPSHPDYILSVLKENSEDVVLLATGNGVPSALTPTPALGLAVGTGDGSKTSFSAILGGPIAVTTLQVLVSGVVVAADDGNGNLVGVGASGTIEYATGALNLVLSSAPAASAPLTANALIAPQTSVSVTLTGGTDGSALESSDIVGANLAQTNSGIYALNTFDIQMSLALPDFIGDVATDTSLLAYAESRGDVVVLLQPPLGSTAQAAVNYKRHSLASTSSFGAMYWPWVKVPDPLNRNRSKVVPAVGHVAGRFAYTDQNENVGKAPAGVSRGQLAMIMGLERDVPKSDRDIVYPAQINPIRSDAEVGTSIWGNKTLQVIGDFTDVNVRRTFIFLEKSQKAGLVDIVFENVGPVTFGLIKSRLDSFLENLFLQGVIGSGVPDKNQAYKVICDLTNNPASVSQQKMIVIDQFIKPNLAAEYIYLRIQKVFDASQA
jgi:hypothetical protein